MLAVRCFSRIDTFELKLEIHKRLGSQKADKYFSLVTRYLSLKLRKKEFDRHCVSLIGRDNVRFHNEFITAIVKNAAVSKIPPQKHVKSDGHLSSNGSYQRTDLQSLCAFPRSPKKGRTPNLRERKFRDRPVSIGLYDNTRLVKGHEQQTATELLSLGSKPPVEVNSVEEGEEVEQDAISPGVCSKTPLMAPFGINFHSKETRKVLCSSSDSAYHTETCHYSGYLPSANSLRNRLKHTLKTENVDISMDCVNVLNSGLDLFLKRVLKPSLELAHSRSLRRPGSFFPASMLDFRVATEINPMILGELTHILHENC